MASNPEENPRLPCSSPVTDPKLTISAADGQSITLPDASAGDFGVVLVLPRRLVPYCNAQLRAFERSGQALSDAGVKVAALSVDDKETTAALVARHQLTFPVGYGANAAAVAAVTGALRRPGPGLPAVPAPSSTRAGNVVVSVYSTGAIERLVPRRHRPRPLLREHSPAEAGH